MGVAGAAGDVDDDEDGEDGDEAGGFYPPARRHGCGLRVEEGVVEVAPGAGGMRAPRW